MQRLAAIVTVLSLASCAPDLFDLIEVEAREVEPVHVEVPYRRLTKEERAEAEARLRALLRSKLRPAGHVPVRWCSECDQVVDPGCVYGHFCEHLE